VRAPLLCVPASQNRACWEQLRASLRRKEGLFSDALRPDCAALDSLRSSRAKRSSQSLILVGLNEEMDTLSNPTLSAGKRGKDGAPGC
jgi:hypothetical protein